MDDGAKSPEDSLAMAEMAIADGITHVVATPHSSDEYRFDFAAVQRAAAELQAALGTRLQIATGCDFHLNLENLAALRKNAAPFCVHQRTYLLVEFSEFAIPPAVDQTLYEIQLAGLRPVITHPERNAILRTQPDRLEKWIRNGSYSQVTGGSLLGRFGPGAQQTSEQWIARGLVHFVASDAHDLKWRTTAMDEAFRYVQKAFGEEAAARVFEENPRAAPAGVELDGAPLPIKRRKWYAFW